MFDTLHINTNYDDTMYNYTVCDTKCNTMFIFGASKTIFDGIITIIIVIGGIALIIRDINVGTVEFDTVILYA